MPSEGSVTHWLDDVRRGDSAAAQAIWERYFRQLVHFARTRLVGLRRSTADEEDVALAALASFFDAVQHDRFPRLEDRHDLWRLLLSITARKAVDLRRRETRQRRGGGKAAGQSAVPGELSAECLDEIVGNEPTPEFAVMMLEQCRILLDDLDEPDLQSLALAKLQGYSNEEIAAQWVCSIRTVERRLHRIRKRWQRRLEEPGCHC